MDAKAKSGQMRVLVLSGIFASIVIIALFLPWVNIPVDFYVGTDWIDRISFPLISVNRLLQYAQNTNEIMSVNTLAARMPIIYIAMVGIVLSLAAYFWLYIKKSRKAIFFGFVGFLGFIALNIFFLDTVFFANSDSAFAGPGLFADRFLTIMPVAYTVLFLCIFACAVILPYAISTLSEDYEDKLIAKAKKRQALKGAGFKKRSWPLISDIIRDRYLYLMLIPFIAYYIIFFYLPYSGIRIAFMDFRPLWGFENSPWVGLDHFRNFFTGPFFWRIFRNTLILNLYGLFWSFPIPIILAVLFNELRNKKFRTLAQTISYIPYFISSVVIAGLVINLLSPSTGVINTILGWFGVEPIYFMVRTSFFRTIFISQGIWAWMGFGSIIYFSAICGIDAELFEAATIDGAGRLKQIRHVMFPCLLPTISIMLILAIGGLVNSSTEMVLLLQRPATYDVSDIIGTFVWRTSMATAFPNFSMSTAVGLFEGVIACILVLSANKISKRVGETSIL